MRYLFHAILASAEVTVSVPWRHSATNCALIIGWPYALVASARAQQSHFVAFWPQLQIIIALRYSF